MIRPARPQDVPAIHQLIRELADYEKSLDQVTGTQEDLRRSLFAEQPAIFAHVAEQDGAVAGFALWFLNYSTWLGQHGMYLEDLYVTSAVRGSGLGRALLAELAKVCRDRDYGRLQWWVLDWNAPALGFYRRVGAVAMDEWTVWRLSGAALAELAADGPPAPA